MIFELCKKLMILAGGLISTVGIGLVLLLVIDGIVGLIEEKKNGGQR